MPQSDRTHATSLSGLDKNGDHSNADKGNATRTGTQRWVLVSVLFVGCVLVYLSCRTGYRAGMSHPWDGSSLGIPMALALSGIQVFLLLKACSKPSGKIGGPLLVLALLLLGPQLFLFYNGSYLYAGNGAFSRINSDRALLHVLGAAIEAYRIENGAYPGVLENLLSSKAYREVIPQLPSQKQRGLPISSFGRGVEPRYLTVNVDGEDPGHSWILWLPGVDEQYDIEDCPDLRSALKDLCKDPSTFPKWIADRIYDPVSGRNTGDIVCRKEELATETKK